MKKRLILHDLPEERAAAIFPPEMKENTVFSALPLVKGCLGCFGCWTKTPGICVIQDRVTAFPALMATHEELVIVSRMVFGGVSPEVKAVLDRSIGFILPFFRIVGGEMHHVQRHEHTPNLKYAFYGPDISAQNKEIAKKLVAANGVNFGSHMCTALFYNRPEDIGEVLA